MKKIYEAPVLEFVAFLSDVAISANWSAEVPEEPAINSTPWNDGELGWGGWT